MSNVKSENDASMKNPSNESLASLGQKKYKFLVGLTGSIACYKTCALISRLKNDGHEVRAVASENALKFVGLATLEGLTQAPVLSSCFENSQMMDHIHWARWADIYLVAPITANHINKFSYGFADDLLTTLFLAFEQHKQVFLAPAMNHVMFESPIVKESLLRLKKFGVNIIQPTNGRLACDEVGIGKMQEPDEIVNILYNHLASVSSRIAKNEDLSATATSNNTEAPTNYLKQKNKNILITYGGTKEYIDGVRTLSNFSTGNTGAALAEAMSSLGYLVTGLIAQNCTAAAHLTTVEYFDDHKSLSEKIVTLLQNNDFQAVIHLAAVSDFSVDRIITNEVELTPSKSIKIDSSNEITLKLKPTNKIVDHIKPLSLNSNITVIAFKLTNTKNLIDRDLALSKILSSSSIDYVVHNDLNDYKLALDVQKSTDRPFTIYNKSGFEVKIQNVNELAVEINKILVEPSQAQVFNNNSTHQQNYLEQKITNHFEVKNGFMS
ncbi:MAG: bifunctional phosphopantothenoylcysteine decarboxylase/phosphopantothenate--cysteine ligase CoaBC [Bdellovibrionales bacterium]